MAGLLDGSALGERIAERHAQLQAGLHPASRTAAAMDREVSRSGKPTVTKGASAASPAAFAAWSLVSMRLGIRPSPWPPSCQEGGKEFVSEGHPFG